MKNLSGVYTALVTPFKKGEVDSESLTNLVRFQLEHGIQGFVVSGTTAESPCLSKDEKKRILDIVRGEVSGQVPVVLGTGSNNTAETIAATREAEAWGADGVLIVVPYYNKPPQRGLVAHFKAAAAATKLPVLLYNVPGRTITALDIDSIAELAKVSNIVGIKDATGDIALGKKTIQACGKDFLVTSGDDASFLQLVAEGGGGIVSVASHILPREFVRWLQRARHGSGEANVAMQSEMLKYQSLISQLYVEANPIPVKMALHLMGIIASAEMRLPLMSLSEAHTGELRSRMKAMNLL